MGKGYLIAGIILMCVGFGNVIYHSISPPETPAPTRPPSEVTPAPQLTSSEITYAVTIADHAYKVSDAMYNLSDLMENPQIGDDEWTFEVAVEIATIRLLYDEAMDIDPPSSMSNIHNKYVQAMHHLDKASGYLTQGIDELDPDLINQSIEELIISGQLLDEATQLIDEFTEAHSK